MTLENSRIELIFLYSKHGFVFFDTENFEIAPLSGEEPMESHRIQERSASSFGEPHVIYRRRISSINQAQLLDMQRINVSSSRLKRSSDFENKDKDGENVTTTLTIELGKAEIFSYHCSGVHH
jgi:hypothetical protein